MLTNPKIGDRVTPVNSNTYGHGCVGEVVEVLHTSVRITFPDRDSRPLSYGFSELNSANPLPPVVAAIIEDLDARITEAEEALAALRKIRAAVSAVAS